MADFVFPSTDADLPMTLLNLLGSFWANTFHGRDQVQSYARARGQLVKQTERDLMELIASVSRFEVPVFHKDNWYLLRLLESERNDAQTSLLLYDDPDVDAEFDGTFRYDEPLELSHSAFPLPTNLHDVRLITNRITSPSVTLVNGVDFIIDTQQQALVFRNNPFNNSGFGVEPIIVDGEVTDQELAMWLFMGDFDLDRVFQLFGYVIGMRLQSSEGYRDLMNAVFDGIVGGPVRQQVETAFSAMTGIPLVQDDQETVELITTDASHDVVVTDANVYKFKQGSNILVSKGQTLTGGAPITDGLQIDEFNTGQVPDDLAALAVGKGFLSAGFLGDLVFENKDVTLEVDEEHSSGYTRVSWELGGFELDVEEFFDRLHDAGVEADQTLAMLLDTRTNPEGQPTAFNLPDTINPLKFLIQNVMRNNVFLVRVKVGETVKGGVGLENIRFLRKIIPPHTAMIVLFELTSGEESVTLESVDESNDPFVAAEPLEESVQAVRMDDAVTVRTVSEACQ